MQIKLNGEAFETNSQNVAQLVAELGVSEKMIALALNTIVVKKENWQNAKLAENDEVEILQFMGGG